MPHPTPQACGKVYLVGVGPGSVDHLTLKARACLEQAEVVVYDALVDEALLSLLPEGCEQIQMGKRGGQPSPQQTDIDQVLVASCQRGKRVVRLKSGDPFIFGRTASEIQALKAAGCDFEVVPGLSSALAAPLLVGIPLTDPVWSHGFTVITAHDPDTLEWSALAQMQTLVLLMAARTLPDITQQLIRHGKRPDTPIALIRWASQPQQQVWEGTLLSIEQVTKGEALSPCVIVIGEVVRLRPYLQRDPALQASVTPKDMATNSLSQPFPSPTPMQPLTGKTVLITRSAGQSSQFSHLLTEQGATVLEMPALEIHPPSSWQPLDDAIASLPRFNWLVLTSANAVTYFMERLLAQGKDARSLAHLKLAVVGQKTAGVLAQWGLKPDFIPPDFVADAMVEHFPEPVSGQSLLFPRVESGGREVLVKELTAAGATVVEVPAYESGCPLTPDLDTIQAFEQGKLDVVTFASSKTVRHFCQLLEQGLGMNWQARLAGVAIASIGPKTSETCHECLSRVDIEAEDYTLEGLTQALVTWASASSD